MAPSIGMSNRAPRAGVFVAHQGESPPTTTPPTRPTTSDRGAQPQNVLPAALRPAVDSPSRRSVTRR